jgi:hypothetical protein
MITAGMPVIESSATMAPRPHPGGFEASKRPRVEVRRWEFIRIVSPSVADTPLVTLIEEAGRG